MASIQDYGNGKYRVLVCNGRKKGGSLNRDSCTIEASSRKAAERKAAEFEYEFKHRQEAEKEVEQHLFKDLVAEWKRKERLHYSDQTLETYEGILKNYMIPVFGERELISITKKDISDYVYSLTQNGIRKDNKKGGLSKKSIRNHFVLLSSLFTYAIDYDMLKENVCSQLKHKPQPDEHEADFYEPEEVEKMLDCLEEEIGKEHLNKAYVLTLDSERVTKLNDFVGLMYKTYTYLALASACRRSELLGLDWNDIDFNNNLICIRKVSLYTASKGIYSRERLKNGSPSKVVTLPIEVIQLLEIYKIEQEKMRKLMGNDWVSCDRLFTAICGNSVSVSGGAMHPDTISQWFTKFLLKFKLPKITLHEVRHTSISYLINAKLDIKAIAERAGHSSTVVTTKIYGHVFERNRRECADVIGEMFGEKKPTQEAKEVS